MFKTITETFKTKLTTKPKTKKQNYELALKKSKMKDHEKAIRLFQKALNQDNKYKEAWLEQGKCYQALKELDKANNCYAHALEIDGFYIEALNKLASSFISQKKYVKAKEKLKKSLGLNQRNFETLKYYAKLYFVQGRLKDYENAKIFLLKALEIDENHKKTLFKLGMCCKNLQNKNYRIKNKEFRKEQDDAIYYFERALKFDQNNIEVHYNCGVSYAMQGEHEKAIKHYDKALKLDKDLYYVYNDRGASYVNLGNFKKGREDFQKALKYDENDKDSHYNLAISYARQNEHKLAIQSYAKALKIDRVDPEAWKNKGNSYAYLGQHEKAINCYKLARDINPNYDGVLNNEAFSLNALKKYKKAIKKYKKALVINPKDEIIHSGLGTAYKNNKQYDEAIESYTEAINLAKSKRENYYEFKECYYNKGNCYVLKKKHQDAIIPYLETLGIEEEDIVEGEKKIIDENKRNEEDKDIDKNIWNNLGVCYKHMKNYPKAMICYKQAILYDEKYKTPYKNLGVVYNIKEKYEDAIINFDKAFEIDNKYKEALNNKGISYNNMMKFEEAIEEFEKVLELDPKYKENLRENVQNIEALNNIGVVHCNLEQYDKAIQIFKEVLLLDDNHKNARINLGVAYNKKKKYVLALECFEEALEKEEVFEEALEQEFIREKAAFQKKNGKIIEKEIVENGKIVKKMVYEGKKYKKEKIVTIKNIIIIHLGLTKNNLKDFGAGGKELQIIAHLKRKNDEDIESGKKKKELVFNDKNYREFIINYHNKLLADDDDIIRINHNNLGISYQNEENPKKAQEYFEKAIKDGYNRDAYYNLGNLEFDMEKIDKAIEYYKNIKTLDKDTLANIALSIAYHKNNKWKKCYDCLGTALEIIKMDKDKNYFFDKKKVYKENSKIVKVFFVKKIRKLLKEIEKLVEKKPTSENVFIVDMKNILINSLQKKIENILLKEKDPKNLKNEFSQEEALANKEIKHGKKYLSEKINLEKSDKDLENLKLYKRTLSQLFSLYFVSIESFLHNDDAFNFNFVLSNFHITKKSDKVVEEEVEIVRKKKEIDKKELEKLKKKEILKKLGIKQYKVLFRYGDEKDIDKNLNKLHSIKQYFFSKKEKNLTNSQKMNNSQKLKKSQTIKQRSIDYLITSIMNTELITERIIKLCDPNVVLNDKFEEILGYGDKFYELFSTTYHRYYLMSLRQIPEILALIDFEYLKQYLLKLMVNNPLWNYMQNMHELKENFSDHIKREVENAEDKKDKLKIKEITITLRKQYSKLWKHDVKLTFFKILKKKKENRNEENLTGNDEEKQIIKSFVFKRRKKIIVLDKDYLVKNHFMYISKEDFEELYLDLEIKGNLKNHKGKGFFGENSDNEKNIFIANIRNINKNKENGRGTVKIEFEEKDK